MLDVRNEDVHVSSRADDYLIVPSCYRQDFLKMRQLVGNRLASLDLLVRGISILTFQLPTSWIWDGGQMSSAAWQRAVAWQVLTSIK